MDILEDVLLEAGDIDKFFGITAPINLWRARNLSKKGVGMFDLVEEDEIRNGNIRPADVTIEDGIVKVRDRPRGISTFDKPNIFPRGRWEYYKIPKGAKLPNGLVIVQRQIQQKFGRYTLYNCPLPRHANRTL